MRMLLLPARDGWHAGGGELACCVAFKLNWTLPKQWTLGPPAECCPCPYKVELLCRAMHNYDP